MPVFEKHSTFPFSRDALWQYHQSAGALERLVPPWQKVRILENAGPLREGKHVTLSMKIGPIWKRWVAEHFDVVEGERFRDRQTHGPFASWVHTHEMKAVEDSSGLESKLTDHVDYELPLGAIGRVLGGAHVRTQLNRMFSFRHARTANDLRQHSYFADQPRLRVAISGSTGAIANNLIPFLKTGGNTVRRIVRAEPRASSGSAGEDDLIHWDATTGAVDRPRLADCDALVHLAGQNIATRWTRRRRDQIWRSRVDATRNLCETLAAMPRRPGVMVCASAVGFFGDRGEEALTEDSPRGDGFVAELCEAWERATQPARDAGVRVVNLRLAVVISANSGALKKLLPPTRLGLAGPVGSGTQWMPWIAMDDVIAAIEFCIRHGDLSGPVNAVTGAVRQRDFIRTLGHVLRRPTIVPMPAAAVNIAFGQMGRELLLASANVAPTRLSAAGFQWTHSTLEAVLRLELGR